MPADSGAAAGTRYLVQIGRPGRGAYRTRYELTLIGQASLYYVGVNVGPGWRARLVQVSDGTRRTLARKIGV